MMKLAVNLSMIFTEVALLERFALAKKHGFDHVEIQFPYSVSTSEIKQQLDLHGLSLCLINVPAGDLMQGGDGLAGVPGREIEFKHAVEQAIEYANALNVPSINILAGKQPMHADLLPCLHTLAENLKMACAMLSDTDIQPVIEMINGNDMPRFLLQNLAQAQDMLDAVQHPKLKLQYDCYHMTMMGEHLLETLAENLDNIGHIQFADVPRRHEPDTADIDYAKVFEWLKQSDYTGFIAAEYKPSAHSENSFAWKSKYFA